MISVIQTLIMKINHNSLHSQQHLHHLFVWLVFYPAPDDPPETLQLPSVGVIAYGNSSAVLLSSVAMPPELAIDIS